MQIEDTEKLISFARQLKKEFQDDPHRPRYHFMPPWGWMNDINGAIFWKGRYHIFYQHNPERAYWERIRWGHASSVDLMHWVHHPVALTPTPEGPDRDGCFSGGAFVDKEGIPTVIYYGVPDGICTATSCDDMLIRWIKHPANPVIPQGKYSVHDPTAWLAGDTYYALVNRRNPGGDGDAAFLFKSPDLVHWEFKGLFYRSDRRWTEPGEDCAVPDFFPLGDKYMLLFGSHLNGTQYYLGRLDGDRYHPEIHGRMSWPGGQLIGARTLLDGKGRRIYFDWIGELRSQERQRASGWSGVMTLPRVLSLAEDGTLRIEPVGELEVLRMNHRVRRDILLRADSELLLNDVSGDSLELAVETKPKDAQEFGVKVRCSPDGAEQTAVSYDAVGKKLKLDVSKSTLDKEIKYTFYRNSEIKALEGLPEEARFVQAVGVPFDLAPGETLRLRIFLDRSVVEVFANGRQCITERIYPTRPDSMGVLLFSRGGSVNFKSVEAWDVAPTHD